MKTLTKLTAVGGILLAGTMAFSQSAVAAACPASQTLLAFTGAACESGDKRYTWLADNIGDPEDVQIKIAIVGEYFNFSVNPITPNFPIGTIELDYQVEILDPDYIFRDVELAVDAIGGLAQGLTITKFVDTTTAGGQDIGTLVSTNGASPVGPLALCGDCSTIFVRDEVVVTQADTGVNSWTNAYRQKKKAIPEPTTVALLGLGIAGIGFARRRKGA